MSKKIEVLYEDRYIIAVNKPAGIPMHANLDLQRENLADSVLNMLNKKGCALDHLGIHQRLDLGTSGIVVFAKSSEANPSLAKQFESRSVRKIYLALAESKGHLASSCWECRYSLGDPVKRGGPVSWKKGTADSFDASGGRKKAGNFKNACTVFNLLKRSKKTVLLQAELKSGRKHQIRAHLAAQKMPIAGDVLYGGNSEFLNEAKAFRIERPMLHAAYLQLEHPVSGNMMELRAPLPEDFYSALKFFNISIGEDLCLKNLKS